MKDLALKLFCLLIAVVLWAYVKSVVLQNTTTTKTFHLLPTNYDQSAFQVTRLQPEVIKLSAEGPPSTISELKKFNDNDFVALVDLSNATPGIGQYPVKVQRDEQRDYGITYSKPDPVVVTIEPKETSGPKQVLVQLVNIPAGYVEASKDVSPKTVTVSGPKSDVESVTPHAYVDMSHYLTTPGKGLQVEVELLNAQQRKVTTVEPDPKQVTVYPVLAEAVRRKNALISPTYKGQPPFGYRVQHVKISPEQVLITGDPGHLRALDTIETEPIDVSNLTKSHEFRVSLRVPQGVDIKQKMVRVLIDVVAPPPTPTPAPKEQPPSVSAH